MIPHFLTLVNAQGPCLKAVCGQIPASFEEEAALNLFQRAKSSICLMQLLAPPLYRTQVDEIRKVTKML